MIVDGNLIRDTDNKYCIQFSQSDRNKIIYRESDRQTVAFIEQSYGVISVNVSSIVRWAEPYSDDLISDIEKDRILSNIEKAILAIDCKLELY